jgi:hypothetical protein
MLKKTLSRTLLLIVLSFFLTAQGFAQKDNIAQIAIDTVRAHMGLPPGIEVKFIEKKESPVPGFYSVKLSLVTPDREIPTVIYVDKTGDRVFLGTLIVKGENVTRKEAGEVSLQRTHAVQGDDCGIFKFSLPVLCQVVEEYEGTAGEISPRYQVCLQTLSTPGTG